MFYQSSFLAATIIINVCLNFTPIISIFCFIYRQLSSELNKRNSTKTCHMFRSECDLKIRVKNLSYPLSLKIATQNAYFDVSRRLRNLVANLTANIFRTKHDIGAY